MGAMAMAGSSAFANLASPWVIGVLELNVNLSALELRTAPVGGKVKGELAQLHPGRHS